MIVVNTANAYARVTARGILWTTDPARATRFAPSEATRIARSFNAQPVAA